jgi:hypothetical protein
MTLIISQLGYTNAQGKLTIFPLFSEQNEVATIEPSDVFKDFAAITTRQYKFEISTGAICKY